MYMYSVSVSYVLLKGYKASRLCLRTWWITVIRPAFSWNGRNAGQKFQVGVDRLALGSLGVWRKEPTLPLFNVDRALPCKGRASRPPRAVGNLQTCCLYSGLHKGVVGSNCILADQRQTLPSGRAPSAAILLLSLTERIYSTTCGCKVRENWGSQPPASEECISWCCWKGRTEEATATCTANISKTENILLMSSYLLTITLVSTACV